MQNRYKFESKSPRGAISNATGEWMQVLKLLLIAIPTLIAVIVLLVVLP